MEMLSCKEVTENRATPHFVDSASQNEQLWRRAFTLAIADPLYKLSPDARRTPLDLVDYFSIAMKIIERVLNGLHLGSMEGGVRREVLQNDISDWIITQVEVLCREGLAESVPSQDMIGKQADDLIDVLLNCKAGTPFEARIFSYQDNLFKTVKFRLLEEFDGTDGYFYLRPSIECANLYFTALSQPLEDKQVAIQAVLDHQLKAGKIEEANKTADEHRSITYQHRNTLMNLIRQIRINVRDMQWKSQIRPQIEEALINIQDFRDTDNRILAYIEEDLAEKQVANTYLLIQLKDKIQECLDIYLNLYEIANRLDDEFLDAQVHQCFFDSQYEKMPNLTEEILLPFLKLPFNHIENVLESLEPAIMGPITQPLHDLVSIVQSALMPRKDSDEQTFIYDEEHSEELSIEINANVTKRDVAEAEALIKQGLSKGTCTLHELIESVPPDKENEGIVRALVALVHAAYTQDSATFYATKMEKRFVTPFCCGDDLRITKR
ncbi:MAG: hypothetical protein DRR08_17805 [Candidatus Parabeggiatoa sp. nov. 2]|nr:MAG: hypothetical protein B6247_09850 [Beggiatoa sp. 4572_84]RKZ57902.1 MAG: hypothetical protein DRR08_17805 [Gammaproteobacteria bacterium]